MTLRRSILTLIVLFAALVPPQGPGVERGIAHAAPIGTVPALRPVLRFLGANPNPFRDQTVLRFSLARGEHVSLRVYSVSGRLVATLIEGRLPQGDHSALFRGDGLSAGTYFAAITAGSEKATRRMVVVR
jgi:hypothetical protein